MSVTLQVDTRNLQIAMGHFTQLKNKSDADVVNKAMRFWVPFAAAKVKAVTPSPASLRRRLTNQARRVRGSDKKAHALRNSVAASIVARALIKKHGSVRAGASTDAIFYEKVSALLEAKVWSVNYIRAGFIPVFKQLEVPMRGMPAQHFKFRGRSRGVKARPKLSGVVEAYATNQREGAFEIAPHAFTSSIPEVTRQFLKWIDQDTRENARKSGFY